MRKHLQFVYIISIFTACTKPYNPPAIVSPGTYLVVEGVINSGSDSTVIKLSKTVRVANHGAANLFYMP
ncbi:MAG: hypothetical protein ABI113_15385 [Mucilaginibacter sp.]